VKLISYCLYGNRPMYLRGAVENARLAPVIYPGWKVRVYCETDTPADLVAELEGLGCQIRRMGRSIEHSGMIWRVLPAWEPGISRVIFRDTDSRLNVREAAAVREWIASGFAAHSMLDHPHHANCVLMCGTWGVMGGLLPGWLMPRFVEHYSSCVQRADDTAIVAREIFPHIRGSLLTHASIKPEAALDWPARPFPAHEPWAGFVGQQIDDDGKPMWAGLPPAVRSGGEVAA
jgi:hypothetical protein